MNKNENTVNEQEISTPETWNDYTELLLERWNNFLNPHILTMSDEEVLKPKLILQNSYKQLINHCQNDNHKNRKTIYGVVTDSVSDVVEVITEKNYKRWFDVSKVSFDTLYKDYQNLLTVAKKFEQTEVNLLSKQTTASELISRSNATPNSTESFKLREGYQVKIPLFEKYFAERQFSDADKKYFFDKIRRDSEGNFYFITYDDMKPVINNIYLAQETGFRTGREILISPVEARKNVRDFWFHFLAYFNKNVSTWKSKTLEVRNSYMLTNTSENFETVCMQAGVPRLFLEMIDIYDNYAVKYVKGFGGKITTIHYRTHSDIVYKNGIDAKTVQSVIQKQAISKVLLQSVDSSEETRVKNIKRFSNNPQEIAIKHLHLPSYSNPTEEPKLPPTWSRFLEEGTALDGTKLKRFDNPKMDKMKIACYVVNTLSADYSGRQALTMFGIGGDGKGSFIAVIRKILGEEHSVTVSPDEFDSNNQFGLYGILNKKAICIEECGAPSKLFKSQKFLSVTGHDTIVLEAKYQLSMNYSTAGTTTILATNTAFGLHGMQELTRCMPILWHRNYEEDSRSKFKSIDKKEMVNKLYEEKDDFIQWCVDYRIWLNEKYDRALLVGGSSKQIGTTLKLMSDEDLENRAYLDFTDNELFSRALDTMILRGKPAMWNTVEDEGRESLDSKPSLVEMLFEVDEEGDGLTSYEIRDALEDALNFGNKDKVSLINRIFSREIRRQSINNIESKYFEDEVVKSISWREFMQAIQQTLKVSRKGKRRNVGDGKTKVFKVYPIRLKNKMRQEVLKETVAKVSNIKIEKEVKKEDENYVFNKEDFEEVQNEPERFRDRDYNSNDELPEIWKNENWL